MRRSLVIMLSASVVVHTLALTTYLLFSVGLRPSSSMTAVSSTPALFVSTTRSAPLSQVQPRPLLPKVPALLKSPIQPSIPAEPLSASWYNPDETLSSPPTTLAPSSLKFPASPKTLAKSEALRPSKSVTPASITSPEPLPGHRSVVFLLDVSGSMYEEDGFSTRNIQARRLLTELINALPSDEMFTVVYYAETSQVAGPFQMATVSAKQGSLHDVSQEAECGGGTNLPIGLQTAFSLHPSEIILITDGDLNMDFQDIVDQAPPYDGEKTPSIQIIGIDPREGSNDTDLLKSLADHYNGSFHSVKLDGPAEPSHP